MDPPCGSYRCIYIDATRERKESVKEARFNRDDAAIFLAFVRNYGGRTYMVEEEVAMEKRNKEWRDCQKYGKVLPRTRALHQLYLLAIYRVTVRRLICNLHRKVNILDKRDLSVRSAHIIIIYLS